VSEVVVHGEARRNFAARASEVRAARHFAVTEASRWGLESRALETVVGELAANAFSHAKTPFSVSLHYADEDVSVEVRDGSAALPFLPGVEPAPEETGRGLVLVNEVAAAWGVRSTSTGKIVWADLPAVLLR
jgi:anti-sigma regulatory factor (Ser/Thr protein kinase)